MLVFAVLTVFLFSRADSEWSYSGEEGPAHWGDLEGSFCDKSSQSPIDINTNDVMVEDFEDWKFEGYEKGVVKADSIFNNGHSLQVNLDEHYIVRVSGGGLPNKYRAVQFHFHWGSMNTQGSEHTVDHHKYAAEMHIVHFNEDKYKSFNKARDSGDKIGVAVLGIFIKVGKENSALKKVFESAKSGPYKDNTIDASDITLSLANALPKDLTTFYRYNGSLTTPLCNEVVVWTLFEETIQISRDQLNVLRSLQDDDGHNISDNYRPVQALNGRTVYYSSASTYTLSFLLSIFCFAVLSLH